MNIMIDYDGTFGADVDMWKAIIPVFQVDHKVYLVTSRGEDTPIDDIHKEYFNVMKIPIIYCDYYAKDDVCRGQGILIDIWIDDDPRWINRGFRD